jgi:hypothetical protein
MSLWDTQGGEEQLCTPAEDAPEDKQTVAQPYLSIEVTQQTIVSGYGCYDGFIYRTHHSAP